VDAVELPPPQQVIGCSLVTAGKRDGTQA
jgi:hypothetical protein